MYPREVFSRSILILQRHASFRLLDGVSAESIYDAGTFPL